MAAVSIDLPRFADSEASPRRRVGRCQLFGVLARGGVATVHLGRWLGSGGFRKMVAVKRLHPQFSGDPDFVAMFLDEARVVARIQHPNVVPVIDFVEEGDELFIVMDYVPGVTLGHLVSRLAARGRQVPTAVVKRLMCDVLHGLHAAHEASDEDGQRLGVIHRDVSPGNILVGIDGHARILDFGVARAAGRITQTQSGVVKGKLLYLAPEQLREGRLSRRTDVYGASVVMWQALTGRRLFDGRSPGDVALQILERRIPRPNELVSGVELALDEIVMRGLQRAPELRWRSADHMAEAIESVGGLASHRTVAEWMRSVAEAELGWRAGMVRAVERSPLESSRAAAMRAARRPSYERHPLLRSPTPSPKRGAPVVRTVVVALVAAAVTVAAMVVARSCDPSGLSSLRSSATLAP